MLLQSTKYQLGVRAMKNGLNQLGRLCGYVGILFFIVAVVGRLIFYSERGICSFSAASIFLAGIGFLVLGCWLKLEAK